MRPETIELTIIPCLLGEVQEAVGRVAAIANQDSVQP